MDNDRIDSIFMKFLRLFFLSLAIVVAILFVVFILTSFQMDPLKWLFYSIKAVFYKPADPLADDQKEALKLLISHGVVFTSDNVINYLTEFYNNVITILLGLVAAVSVLTFVYIRVQSYEKMEQVIEKKVGDHFKTSEYIDSLGKAVSSNIGNLKEIQSLENSDIQQSIEEVSERVAVLEGRNEQPDDLEYSDDLEYPDDLVPNVDSRATWKSRLESTNR